MTDRYDAVVVGSGPNGLTAAITLARAGRSVLVCEAQPRLGGAVATEELTLPGFAHDVFSSVYPAGAASPVFERMPLADHGLEWVHPEVAMAHPLDDGRAAGLWRDLEATAAHLDTLHEGDGRSWRAFCAPYLANAGALRKTLLGGFPPLAGGLRLALGLRLDRTLEFARVLFVPGTALSRELFAGEHGRAWLLGSIMHGDVLPGESASAITGVYMNLLGHLAGWPSPRGGAARLVDAMVSYLRSLGGETRINAQVDQVLSVSGRVAGVFVAGGDSVQTDTVIADVTPPELLRIAGPSLPVGYRHKLDRFRTGLHTLKVDWALDGPVPWRAETARRAGTVHLGGDADEIVDVTGTVRRGGLPERPFCLFGQQSIADSTRAPAGKHTAWAYTRVPEGVDWTLEAERHADRVEGQVERFAPGFRDLILARHVLSPGTLEDLDANLVGGDVGGGSYTLDQLIFRPVPSLVPYRTPLRGLYIGSASAFPGGAVHGVPGHAAARFALWESRLPFR